MFRETWNLMQKITTAHKEIRIGSFEDDGGLRVFIKNINTGDHNEIKMFKDQPELLEKTCSLVI